MRKLVAAVTASFLMVVVVFSNTVFGESPQGGSPDAQILKELDQIQYILDNNVVPKLGILSGEVPKTGQTTSYAPGDDGALQKGVASPNPRFTDHGNGAVTDNLTGLIWMANAGCFGTQTWNNGLVACNTLASGSCGLTDSSVAGNWRLPNAREISSLIDFSQADPALATGCRTPACPFHNVYSSSALYWTSTTYPDLTINSAYVIDMLNGSLGWWSKPLPNYVWCVR